MTAQQKKTPFKTPSKLQIQRKKVVLIISRCVDDPDKFRLLRKESSLGQNIIMFPASKILKGSGSISSAFRASNKCAIYGELILRETFDWDDENGIVDVCVYEAIEAIGSGFDVEGSMILLTIDEIIDHKYTTPLTKEAASHYRVRLQS